MHKGELASAEKNLRRALKIDPHSLAALNNLGIVLAREGKPAEAIPLYQEALKVRPGNAATQRNLALAYFKAQRYRSAWNLPSAYGGEVFHGFSDPRSVGPVFVCA